MSDIGKLRLAMIGVSHWHVPLYLSAVKRYELNVVAVSDDDYGFAKRVAADLGCKAYRDSEAVLESARPDFAFVFGMHSEMPQVAELFISNGVPLGIEKPLGLNRIDVAEVKRLAAEHNAFCAVPFIWRYSGIIDELRKNISGDDIVNMSFQFIAGPPERYLSSSPWMLERRLSGGGCMTNLGVHFIDLSLLLSASQSLVTIGSKFTYARGYDVEDYAVGLLATENGASIVIETGYAYPMDELSKRLNSWTIATTKGYCTVGNGCIETRRFTGDTTEKTAFDTDSDTHYATFVHQTLSEYVNGKKPTAGLNEMLNVRFVLDELVEKAERNSITVQGATIQHEDETK